MIKHYLKLIIAGLCLLFGSAPQLKAEYVSTITSGNYYRIVSAYSGFNTADKYVMYVDDSGNLGWRAYDSNKEAEQVFLITVESDKTIKIDSNINPARNVKCIGNNYYIHMGGDWYGTAGTSLNAWPINFVQSSANTSQWVIYPAQAGPNYTACCQGLQPDNTANTSGTITKAQWNTVVNYADEKNCWYLEPVESSVYQPILDANDALKNALQTYEEGYNTLVSSDETGYYVKTNVDAFKAYYETCLTAYNNGSNSLTDAQKSTYADNLAAAYATAISAINELTEGYYVIKSAASAFGSNQYAMYIDDNGKVAWGAYNESILGQFVFQLTDLHQTATPDGVTYEKFSFYSPYQQKYIGQGTAQMATEDARTSDERWGVVCQRQSTQPQYTIQPMWNTGGTANYCLIVDNTNNTSGVVRTSGWYNSTGNSNRSWTFTAIDEATALAAIASMDELKTALENYADAYSNIVSSNNPGYYVKANVDAFKAYYDECNTAYNNGNNSLTNTQKSTYASNLASAYTTATSATNPIEDNAYYNIVSVYPSGTKRALCIETDGTFVWKDYDATNSGQFAFKFTNQNQSWGNDSGTTSYAWAMQSVLSGKYIGAGVGNGSGMNTDAAISDTPYNVCVTATNIPGQFILQPRRVNDSGFAQGLTVQDGGAVRQTVWCGARLSGNDNGCWKFEKVDLEAVTIGATGYSTYVSDKALVIPEGVTANGVTGLDGSDVELTQLSGNVLAADEPVILQGEAGKKFYFIVTDEIGNSIAGNLLEGTGTEGKSIGANEAYVLYNNQGTAVFRIAGAMTLPAHKAYLPAGVVNGAGAKEFGLGGLTGINNAQTSNLESQTYFDLQGRKVAAPQKGQLYIINGKKVLY